MCLFRLSELYCVSTKMRRRPELMQLLMGMSMMRYFPAMGTAGFDRSCVRGKSRVPRPPPRITARQSFMVFPSKLDGRGGESRRYHGAIVSGSRLKDGPSLFRGSPPGAERGNQRARGAG